MQDYTNIQHHFTDR